jgi:hypothetical protein
VEQFLIAALTPRSAGFLKLTVSYMDRSKFHQNLFVKNAVTNQNYTLFLKNFSIKKFKSFVVLLVNNYRRFERLYSFPSSDSSSQRIELDLLVPEEKGNINFRNIASYLSVNVA